MADKTKPLNTQLLNQTFSVLVNYNTKDPDGLSHPV